MAGDGAGELVSETYITGFPTYPTHEGSAIMLVEAPCSGSDSCFLPLIQHATMSDTNETIQQNTDAITLAMDKPPIVMTLLTISNAAVTFLSPEVSCCKASSRASLHSDTAVLASMPHVTARTPYSRASRMEQMMAAIQARNVTSSSETRIDLLFAAGWFLLRCAKNRYVMTMIDHRPCE
jgi:hypothetical protein